MTTINTSSLSSYSSALSLTARKPEAVQADETKTSETTRVSADLSGAKTGGASKSKSTATTPTEEMIEQIKKQIEQTEKQLEQQRAQLAAVQSSKADEQTKAQQVMAIQVQIAATSANLQTLQGSLLQLIGGSIDTTA
ncbi:hypothetical protein PS3A_45770 [Pseudomonas sp. 3A(2025)]